MATTVLVIDDDPGIVELLETALEDEGYRVFATVDGEALQVARTVQPAVILLDIMMPGMDGVEVSRRLRDDPATSGIPIIAMSARSNLMRTGSLMRADDKLPKPFDLQQLYLKVGRWARP